MAENWLRFWDRPHKIYVNERHLALHYVKIADDLISILPQQPEVRMLDFGCGEALDARRVALHVAKLWLHDGAPSVREHLRRRFADVPNIDVLDRAGVAALPDGACDLVAVVSVVQYIPKPDMPALLADLRRLLAPGATLVITDVIPPDAGMVDDIRSLLTTAWRHGFVLPALAGMVATLFSDYRRLRNRLGFSIYSDAELLALLRSAGLTAVRAPRNLGFHPRRMTYVARAA